MGHVRDLPKSKFGVDVEKNFAPQYVTMPDKKKGIEAIEGAAKKAGSIYLATDPDREGEAIAWHVAQLLGIQPHTSISRIVFHEITETALKEALANPREVDMDLVNAQQARRVLDRIVGYKLSPLLWKKIRRGLSAGRVQSVAVRLIVEREREIEKFKSEDYWKIFAAFRVGETVFVGELEKKDGVPFTTQEKFNLFAGDYKVSKTSLKTESEAETLILDIEEPFKVASVETKESGRRPPAPFTTSTLAQTAGRRLGMTSRQTMRVAQGLYEEGLITYHRTDSTNLSTFAIAALRDFIEKEYGKPYLPPNPFLYKTRSRVAQEAHEAIRPTEINRVPGRADTKLERDRGKLYELIWKRAVSSQMAPSVVEDTKATIVSKNGYEFLSSGTRVIFDGWWKVSGTPREESVLPKLEEGHELPLVTFGVTEHKTQPPPRYSEAALIAALEKEGIGRPSTYAPIISTILDRHYVERTEGRFQPSLLGVGVNDFLVQNFPTIVDLPFTVILEESLDEIARGDKKWTPVIKGFWDPFSKKLETVEEKSERVKIPVEVTGEKCPKCGSSEGGMQVIRVGRFGKFLSCSRFPECDWKEQFVEKIGMKCPECKSGEVILRKTRKGRQFYGCSRYPQCKWASWKKPFDSAQGRPSELEGEPPANSKLAS